MVRYFRCTQNDILLEFFGIPPLAKLILRHTPQRVFQLLTKSLSLLVRSLARDVDRFFEDHFAAGKWQRNLKSIPGLGPKFPMHMVRERNDRQASDLRQ